MQIYVWSLKSPYTKVDEIPKFIVKARAASFASVLYISLTFFWQKTTFICPIFKKGDQSEVTNYL